MGLDNFLNDNITEEDSFRYSLMEVLQTRVLHTPDEVAFIFLVDGESEQQKLTYRELHEYAEGIAQEIKDRCEPGDRALMFYPPGLEFVKALFGCFYAGVIAVPAYPPRKNRSLERIRTLVKDSGSSIVLSTDEIIQASERSFSDITELQKLNWLSTNQISKSSPPPCLPASMPSDIALLQYTSGSTGHPKGVMVTHTNIMRNAEYIRQSFSLSRKSVSVTWLPSFHDMGLIDGVLVPVYTGFPGVILPPVSFLQKPVRWPRAISKYKGTHCGGPNFAFDLCVDGVSVEEKVGLDLSCLDTLYCGAEPIRKTTFERFVSAYRDYGFTSEKLYPCYGMAETTLIISGPAAGRGPVYLPVSKDDLEQHRVRLVDENDRDAGFLVGVGYPWIDTRVRIVDPETLKPCKDDEVGEIWVNGSIVTAGYWENPEETNRTFKAEPEDEKEVGFLRTGDLGFFHEGELYISGRLKDLIILRGRNYYPQDIEFLAEKSHPALRANASAAFSINKNGEEQLVIVAEVERTALRDLDVEAVCDAIRLNIAEELELEVHGIILLRTASILKTSSGKIQRKACREALLEKTLEIVGESFIENLSEDDGGPQTRVDLSSVEAWLMVWIHTKLKISLEKIDSSKPIIVYGLSSMKAISLQQDFLSRYGVNFPPYMFFERISLKELAARAYKLIRESGNQ